MNGYDILAERADDDLERTESPWGDSFFQQHYSWPAARSTLPDVADSNVLIAGCGRGDHVGWFRENGATVVGVDASERALEVARTRFSDDERATFRRANLEEPLEFPDDAFDLVFSHLVLDHIEAWGPVFEEFRRVLSPGGKLVFAVIHPAYLRDTYADEIDTCYETAKIVISWPNAEIPTYYRPVSAMFEALTAVGFRVDILDEPRPLESLDECTPERYERALDRPEVCCVRARVS